MDKESAGRRLQHGLPLLEYSQLLLDWSVLPRVYGEVAAVFARYPQLFLDIAGLDMIPDPGVARAWYEGSDTKGLSGSVLHATLKPFLVRSARAVVGLVEQGQWLRGFCPICGGCPDLAFLDRTNGSRWLLCSRCDTAWLFQRMQCPCCDAVSQQALTHFTDVEGIYRLYVCEDCGRYLKAVDLRRTRGEVLLPLERLLTADLDRQAVQMGYHPPG